MWEYGLTENRTCSKITFNPHKEDLVRLEVKMREKCEIRVYILPSGGGAYCKVQGTERARAQWSTDSLKEEVYDSEEPKS